MTTPGFRAEYENPMACHPERGKGSPSRVRDGAAESRDPYPAHVSSAADRRFDKKSCLRSAFLRVHPRLFSLFLLAASTLFAQSATQKAATPYHRPSSTAGAPASWQQIPIPKLPEFHPQQPKRIQLANGMIIFLQEDHELPLVGGSMRIRGGSVWELAAKTGMLDIYGEVWRTGGTTSRTGDQLDDYLEARAAKVETGAGADSTSLAFNCLKDKFDEGFPIFLDLLRNPAFREDKIDLAKREMDTEIARRNDDIGGIAGREAVRLGYGKDNPYARIPEFATVAAVSREDLLKWHQSFVHPNNIILGIYGDFDSAAMEQRLRSEFEGWPKSALPPKPVIEFHPPKPGIYFIAKKEDVNQSAIRMVALGIERNNPDFFNVEVMNELLGGGFSSRLFKSIRTEKGLAYSVGGGIGAAFDHPGLSRMSMGTKSASTGDAIQALRAELQGMLTHPADKAEVTDSKDDILNAFIFRYDSKAKVLGERLLYEFYGYPADYLERYRAAVEKSTPEDVNRVAHKYIHPDSFATLVVGNAAEFGKPLSTLGPVTPIDITIPPPTENKK